MEHIEKLNALRNFIITLLEEHTLPADEALLLVVINAMTNGAPYKSVDDIPENILKIFI